MKAPLKPEHTRKNRDRSREGENLLSLIEGPNVPVEEVLLRTIVNREPRAVEPLDPV